MKDKSGKEMTTKKFIIWSLIFIYSLINLVLMLSVSKQEIKIIEIGVHISFVFSVVVIIISMINIITKPKGREYER